MKQHHIALLLVLCAVPAAAAERGFPPASAPGLERDSPVQQQPAAPSTNNRMDRRGVTAPRARIVQEAGKAAKRPTAPDVKPEGESDAVKAWREADI